MQVIADRNLKIPSNEGQIAEPCCSARPPKLTVLVATTTWWPSIAILASSLEQAGFAIVLLCPIGHVGHQALHYRTLVLDRRRPMASLSAAMKELSPAFVVPGDDRAVAHLIRLGDDPTLRACVARSLGPYWSHPALTGRAAFMEVAEKLGLAVPDNRSLQTIDDLDRWIDVVPGPWVLKADGAWGGEGVAIGRDRDAAHRAFRALARGPSGVTALWRDWINGDPFWRQDRRTQAGRQISVQAFVAGRLGTCAVYAHAGEMRGATVVETQATYGDQGPSTLLESVDRPALLSGARRLVHELRLSGFFGLDFIAEESTGRAVLIEMNPRITMAARMRGPFGIHPIHAAAEAFGCTAAAADPPRRRFASFPIAWLTDPFAAGLAECGWHDCPWHEPAVLRASLEPLWPERGLLAELPARLRTWRRMVRKVEGPPDYRKRPFAWWIEQDLLRPLTDGRHSDRDVPALSCCEREPG